MRLRPATTDDSEFLLRLRNDALTRMNSKYDAIVPVGVHDKWLREILDHPKSHRLMIAETALYDHAVANASPRLGAGRLDADALDDHSVEISLTIAPEWRGLGYARQIIAGMCKLNPWQKPVIARVGVWNHRSLVAFLHEEFVPQCVVDDSNQPISPDYSGVSRRWVWLRKEWRAQ